MYPNSFRTLPGDCVLAVVYEKKAASARMLCVFASCRRLTRTDKTSMVADTGGSIPALLQTAKALQKARRMQQIFMFLWASTDSAAATSARLSHGRFNENTTDEKNWRPPRRDSFFDA